MIQQTCRNDWCKQPFTVTDADFSFYEKVSPVFNGKKELIPPPTLCPSCRRQRRHAHRNERNMYHRKCDLTGQQIISSLASERDVIVYNFRDWWSDKWDPKAYGKDFDFSRPFFEQFQELMKAVPYMHIAAGNVENCDYCNLMADCKNCYLVFESSHDEDCMHGFWLQKCRDCCELSFSHECERCYEVDNCYNCNRLRWSRNCTNCSDSAFLLDCIGCKDCLLCVNQRHKQFCLLNQQYSEDEYRRKKSELNLGSHVVIQELKEEFEKFSLTLPRKFMTSIQAENCSGNYVQESKNCISCFHAHQAEDCKYGEHVWRNAKDGMDVVTFGRNAELMYETSNTNIDAARDQFCILCWSSSDVLYSNVCVQSENCFGCSNLKNSQYCILNKQYTKDEYETLVPKIIAHMRETGEWGEFFPVSISPYSYHESVAQEYFPLTQDEVRERGWNWQSSAKSGEQYSGPSYELPDDIAEVSDDLPKQILICEVTGKPYKVIPQELKFYRDLGIPVPRKCPDQRHLERMALRNPIQLWNRECMHCGKGIETTYAPDRPEIVYCEECYLKEVY